MEVLLFALFFISALIFFIAGKDDFGRTENKLTIKGENKVPEEIKKEEKFPEVVKKEDKIPEETKKEEKVAEEGWIEPEKKPKKES